jgi:hypothetical protein
VSVNDSAVSDAILGDSIFANANQGIVLSGNGNDLQVAPVLSSAVDSGSATTVAGTLTASPQTTYVVQFFSDPAADPSGSGQGRTLLMTKSVTTNASGVATFSYTIKTALAAGWVISATATSPAGNTSAFSADVTVTTGSSPSKAVQVSMGAGNAPVTTAADLVLGAITSSSSDQDDSLLAELAADQVHATADRRPTRTPAS